MAPTKSGWTKYGTDQIWLDQKWLRPNMGLDQIWVGPNMGPTKYAGPNLVRPKMADQKCLDQIWLDTTYSMQYGISYIYTFFNSDLRP